MMPTVHLAKILKPLGTNSVQQLLRSTGSTERSVFKQAQIAAIDQLYVANKAFRGPFGFPLAEVEFKGNTAVRNFSGGQIHFLSDSPQGEEVTVVRVRFVGFHCNAESDNDQHSPSDEPYFIIGVASASGSKTIRFGPYEDIDSGDNRFEATDIVSEKNDNITPPIVIGIVAMENDHGSPEEAEGKVRSVIEAIEKKFDQAAGFAGISTGNHVIPEFLRDILIGWIPEGISAVFGLADDKIGATPMVLFDNKADLLEFRNPPVKDVHGPNEYSHVININGESEGNFDLFFKVDLFKKNISVKHV